MTMTTLRLYHSLPAQVRPVVATLRGLYLGWWRYGPGTTRLVREALEREHWDGTRWNAWRQARLASILDRAATGVPYYRDLWRERRARGDLRSWLLLEHWPVLEKDTLREDPRRFLADDCHPRRMFAQQTSGTTGKPLRLWRRRRTLQAQYAVATARTRQWYGVSVGDRWARLGGQLVTPVEQRHPPFWVWNGGLRQLYLSSYHLAADLIPDYLDALRHYRVTSLHGYPSCLHLLAQGALTLNRRDLHMKVVITNAEPLMEHQREAIAEAFQCPVQETYGMGEAVAAGSTCSAGRLHQWPEVGLVEVFEGADPVAHGISGDLVCTGLLDADMPLIRYRVGDRGSLPPEEAPCPCGRTLPAIQRIEGRCNDLLLTADGRRVFWLNPVFYGLPVREAQIVQEARDRIRVRYVPTPAFTTDTGQEIVGRLRARLGAMHILLEPVDHVPRSANGKLQAVRCELTPEELEAALAWRPRSQPLPGQDARATAP